MTETTPPQNVPTDTADTVQDNTVDTPAETSAPVEQAGGDDSSDADSSDAEGTEAE